MKSINPTFRFVMIAVPALLPSKNEVRPPLLLMVALPAVVSDWKIVWPPVSRLVIVALAALAVCAPTMSPNTVAPPLRFVMSALPAVL